MPKDSAIYFVSTIVIRLPQARLGEGGGRFNAIQVRGKVMGHGEEFRWARVAEGVRRGKERE